MSTSKMGFYEQEFEIDTYEGEVLRIRAEYEANPIVRDRKWIWEVSCTLYIPSDSHARCGVYFPVDERLSYGDYPEIFGENLHENWGHYESNEDTARRRIIFESSSSQTCALSLLQRKVALAVEALRLASDTRTQSLMLGADAPEFGNSE